MAVERCDQVGAAGLQGREKRRGAGLGTVCSRTPAAAALQQTTRGGGTMEDVICEVCGADGAEDRDWWDGTTFAVCAECWALAVAGVLAEVVPPAGGCG